MDADRLALSTNEGIRRADFESADAAAQPCATARRLRAVLRPVEPTPAFKEELGQRLARAGRGERSPVQIASSPELTREMLVGAALLSVAGALVYLWRTRVPQATPRAAVLEKRSVAREMPFTAA